MKIENFADYKIQSGIDEGKQIDNLAIIMVITLWGIDRDSKEWSNYHDVALENLHYAIRNMRNLIVKG